MIQVKPRFLWSLVGKSVTDEQVCGEKKNLWTAFLPIGVCYTLALSKSLF